MEFYVYDTSTSSYISKSHTNVSSNYLGFNPSKNLAILVNNFDSATNTNRIIVTPGVQSPPIKIAVDEFLRT